MVANSPIEESVGVRQIERKHLPIVTVGALVVGPDSRVLIVKTTKWRGLWGIPGGKVEWGEPLVDSLMRELQEEVGLEVTNIRFALLQEAVIDSQFCREAHFLLLNYYAKSETHNVIPNEEIVEWCWVTPQEAFHYPLNTYTSLLVEHYLEQANDNA